MRLNLFIPSPILLAVHGYTLEQVLCHVDTKVQAEFPLGQPEYLLPILPDNEAPFLLFAIAVSAIFTMRT
jgi:hypothetical protein